MEDMIRLFRSVGLEAQKAKETATNASLAAVFKDMIFKVRRYAAGTRMRLQRAISMPWPHFAQWWLSSQANMGSGAPKSRGMLLYQAAVRVMSDMSQHQDLLVDEIASDKIQTALQLEGAPTADQRARSNTPVPNGR